ncbi:MAG: hypothetical protein ABH806_03750, partial [Candidatus Omnitrophota bacterium]
MHHIASAVWWTRRSHADAYKTRDEQAAKRYIERFVNVIETLKGKSLYYRYVQDKMDYFPEMSIFQEKVWQGVKERTLIPEKRVDIWPIEWSKGRAHKLAVSCGVNLPGIYGDWGVFYVTDRAFQNIFFVIGFDGSLNLVSETLPLENIDQEIILGDLTRSGFKIEDIERQINEIYWYRIQGPGSSSPASTPDRLLLPLDTIPSLNGGTFYAAINRARRWTIYDKHDNPGLTGRIIPYHETLAQIIGTMSHYIKAPPRQDVILEIVLEAADDNPSMWYEYNADTKVRTLHLQVGLLAGIAPADYLQFLAHHISFYINNPKGDEKTAAQHSIEFLVSHPELTRKIGDFVREYGYVRVDNKLIREILQSISPGQYYQRIIFSKFISLLQQGLARGEGLVAQDIIEEEIFRLVVKDQYFAISLGYILDAMKGTEIEDKFMVLSRILYESFDSSARDFPAAFEKAFREITRVILLAIERSRAIENRRIDISESLTKDFFYPKDSRGSSAVSVSAIAAELAKALPALNSEEIIGIVSQALFSAEGSIRCRNSALNTAIQDSRLALTRANKDKAAETGVSILPRQPFSRGRKLKLLREMITILMDRAGTSSPVEITDKGTSLASILGAAPDWFMGCPLRMLRGGDNSSSPAGARLAGNIKQDKPNIRLTRYQSLVLKELAREAIDGGLQGLFDRVVEKLKREYLIEITKNAVGHCLSDLRVNFGVKAGKSSKMRVGGISAILEQCHQADIKIMKISSEDILRVKALEANPLTEESKNILKMILSGKAYKDIAGSQNKEKARFKKFLFDNIYSKMPEGAFTGDKALKLFEAAKYAMSKGWLSRQETLKADKVFDYRLPSWAGRVLETAINELTDSRKRIAAVLKVKLHTVETHINFIGKALRLSVSENDILVESVKTAAENHLIKFDPQLYENFLTIFLGKIKLSSQQEKALLYIALGLDNQHIAERLGIRAWDINQIKKNIIVKLGVKIEAGEKAKDIVDPLIYSAISHKSIAEGDIIAAIWKEDKALRPGLLKHVLARGYLMVMAGLAVKLIDKLDGPGNDRIQEPDNDMILESGKDEGLDPEAGDNHGSENGVLYHNADSYFIRNEQKELFEAIKAGGLPGADKQAKVKAKQAREKVIILSVPVLIREAKRYMRNRKINLVGAFSLMDLVHEAIPYLYKKIKQFDPDRGNFISFVIGKRNAGYVGHGLLDYEFARILTTKVYGNGVNIPVNGFHYARKNNLAISAGKKPEGFSDSRRISLLNLKNICNVRYLDRELSADNDMRLEEVVGEESDIMASLTLGDIETVINKEIPAAVQRYNKYAIRHLGRNRLITPVQQTLLLYHLIRGEPFDQVRERLKKEFGYYSKSKQNTSVQAWTAVRRLAMICPKTKKPFFDFKEKEKELEVEGIFGKITGVQRGPVGASSSPLSLDRARFGGGSSPINGSIIRYKDLLASLNLTSEDIPLLPSKLRQEFHKLEGINTEIDNIILATLEIGDAILGMEQIVRPATGSLFQASLPFKGEVDKRFEKIIVSIERSITLLRLEGAREDIKKYRIRPALEECKEAFSRGETSVIKELNSIKRALQERLNNLKEQRQRIEGVARDMLRRHREKIAAPRIVITYSRSSERVSLSLVDKAFEDWAAAEERISLTDKIIKYYGILNDYNIRSPPGVGHIKVILSDPIVNESADLILESEPA